MSSAEQSDNHGIICPASIQILFFTTITWMCFFRLPGPDCGGDKMLFTDISLAMLISDSRKPILPCCCWGERLVAMETWI